jgi:hypothetical protein
VTVEMVTTDQLTALRKNVGTDRLLLAIFLGHLVRTLHGRVP